MRFVLGSNDAWPFGGRHMGSCASNTIGKCAAAAAVVCAATQSGTYAPTIRSASAARAAATYCVTSCRDELDTNWPATKGKSLSPPSLASRSAIGIMCVSSYSSARSSGWRATAAWYAGSESTVTLAPCRRASSTPSATLGITSPRVPHVANSTRSGRSPSQSNADVKSAPVASDDHACSGDVYGGRDVYTRYARIDATVTSTATTAHATHLQLQHMAAAARRPCAVTAV
mmetsp:Transcript_29849/g.72647  ORF Transcript_29849/g.72647 Transcript_29849/m.72647 type:complete len:230 (+) Transcript_29849:519-1208(+)